MSSRTRTWWLALGCALGGCETHASTDDPDPAACVGQKCDDVTSTGPTLRTRGRFFVDAENGVVILRGINLAGNSKVPPFRPVTDVSQIDALVDLGFNTIRLVFNWEAYEPEAGSYDEAYLGDLVSLAQHASSLGIYVIVDFHQDGFSRYTAGGCGDGFPKWAIPPALPRTDPRNDDSCVLWGVMMVLDHRVHRSFKAFYSDEHGVRTRYLELMERLATAFADVPSVIGYDLFNEPWGWEDSELAPLYADATARIRSADPDAIMFIEGHVLTNTGALPTRLPRPQFANFAYAPHFYEPAVLGGAWPGLSAPSDLGFSTMNGTAEDWDVPLFVGEFGSPGNTLGAHDFMSLQYDKLDEYMASSAQWNYTPLWTSEHADGWNDEDLSIIDDNGTLRPNFVERIYPQRIAGEPLGFGTGEGVFSIEWENQPGIGPTRIFAPASRWPWPAEIVPTGEGLSCQYEPDGRVIACESAQPGTMKVSISP
jgi:endoglycosylceramidase